MRATWMLLKNVIYKTKPKLKSNQSFKADDLEITDPVAVAKQILSIFF